MGPSSSGNISDDDEAARLIDMKILGRNGPRYTKLCSRLQDDLPEVNMGSGRRQLPPAPTSATMDEDHCHIPKASFNSSKAAITKLLIASALTATFMVTEVVGGYLSNSIAIMSDAAHMFSDLSSFLVSLIAIYLAMRPASRKMNFGYHRAEVLGALVSVLLIWVITGVLVYAAVERVISMDFEVEADLMIIIAAIGVVMNIILALVLHAGSGGHGHSHGIGGHSHGHSHSHSSGASEQVVVNVDNSVTAHSSATTPIASSSTSRQPTRNNAKNINIRAAFIHVVGDLLQSIGVLIAAYIIRFYPEYKIADPICTFIFSGLVVITTMPIITDICRVLMEGVPPGVDYNAICSNLAVIPGVRMIHSLHVWTLTTDKNALSVHIAIDPEYESETVLRAAQRVIRYRHHIFHTTIQVERYNSNLMDNCNQCQPLP
ncbi:zinc transporter 2 isoform X2 [Hyalella azteca]|uniref:Zinc transporter 2 isoform X2 n=1 Tax=Hyalella azteca TaxID=294128 RepID=A0A8B7NCV1_HYAAZ|nr:zinc transporter 2 isoform X2 [Hyalella azteca]